MHLFVCKLKIWHISLRRFHQLNPRYILQKDAMFVTSRKLGKKLYGSVNNAKFHCIYQFVLKNTTLFIIISNFLFYNLNLYYFVILFFYFFMQYLIIWSHFNANVYHFNFFFKEINEFFCKIACFYICLYNMFSSKWVSKELIRILYTFMLAGYKSGQQYPPPPLSFYFLHVLIKNNTLMLKCFGL